MSRVVPVLALLAAVSCGRLGFGDHVAATGDGPLPGDTIVVDGVAIDAPPLINGSNGVVTSAGAFPDGPGTPTSTHLVFATGSQTWWLFYLDATGTVLRSAYSTDFVGWRAGTDVGLANTLDHGDGFSVATKQINGVDVLHVVIDYTETIEQHGHLRGVLGPTTISWGLESIVGCPTTAASDQHDGPAVVIGNDDRIYDVTSGYDDGNVCNGTDNAVGNVDASASATFDTGSAWGSAWNVSSYIVFADAAVAAHWGAPLSASHVLTVQADGVGLSQLSNLVWSIGSGTFPDDQLSPGSGSNVFASDLATAVDVNNWGAVHVTDVDDLIVIRLSGGAFTASRFDGSGWSAIASPPAQVTKDATGAFLASDGTSAWLFVVAEDTANTLLRVKFDGNAWGAWTPVETSTQTRRFLTGYQQVVDGHVGLLWTQPNGSAFDLVAELVPAL